MDIQGSDTSEQADSRGAGHAAADGDGASNDVDADADELAGMASQLDLLVGGVNV